MQTTRQKRWERALAGLARHPRRAALAATVLLVVFAALIRAPVIEGSMVDRIAGGNAQLDVARRISAAGGGLSRVAVIATPRAVPIDAVMADVARLRSDLGAVDPRIELQSLDALADQLFLYGLDGGDDVHALLTALAGHPDSGVLVSADARRFLVVLTVPDGREGPLLEGLAAHDWGALYFDHRVLAGLQLERDIAAALQRDLWLLIPVIVVCMLVALLFAFRSWRALFLPVFASAASTAVTFALFSSTGTAFNLVTLLALPIVLIVGLANSCHFLARSDLAERGNDARVIGEALRRVVPPFFFSSLTTAIALASLTLNDVPPIADLGRLAAATLVFVFVLVVLAAPLSLRWYLRGEARSWQHSAAVRALSGWLRRRRGVLTVVLLVVLFAGGFAVPGLSVDSNPRAFFPEDAPFTRAQRQFEKEFYLFSPLQVMLTVGGDTADLAALSAAGALREGLARQPGVRQVRLQPAVGAERSFVMTALLWEDESLSDIAGFLEARRAGLPAGSELIYSSASMVYNDIDRRAMRSLLGSLLWSVVLIFGAMLLVFRTPRTVAAAAVANAVPLMLVCAAIWVIGRPLNLVSVFVFLVALGVIVDDAIHILFCRAAGEPIAGSSIEFSVLLSTAMLCLGLLLCQLSDFPTTREFAAYCALALIGAVVSNLTVLPVALGRFGGRGSDIEVGDR